MPNPLTNPYPHGPLDPRTAAIINYYYPGLAGGGYHDNTIVPSHINWREQGEPVGNYMAPDHLTLPEEGGSPPPSSGGGDPGSGPEMLHPRQTWEINVPGSSYVHNINSHDYSHEQNLNLMVNQAMFGNPNQMRVNDTEREMNSEYGGHMFGRDPVGRDAALRALYPNGVSTRPLDNQAPQLPPSTAIASQASPPTTTPLPTFQGAPRNPSLITDPGFMGTHSRYSPFRWNNGYLTSGQWQNPSPSDYQPPPWLQGNDAYAHFTANAHGMTHAGSDTVTGQPVFTNAEGRHFIIPARQDQNI